MTTECNNCQGTGLQPNPDQSLAERTDLCAQCGGSGQVSDGTENDISAETEQAENAGPLPEAPVEDEQPAAPDSEQAPESQPEAPADELSPEEAQAKLEEGQGSEA